MRHKLCTLFLFFQQTECGERWFLVSVLFAIILQLARQSSFKTAATRAMFLFVFVIPSLRLHSASSINFSPAANWLCHQNTVTRDTDESPNAFTNISHVLAAVNPALQQNFMAASCSQFFPVLIYNTSTEHIILKNALILSHIDDRLTSNLVCRWRRV